MDKWRGKVAVVTGASSGIGAAIARSLVHHGMVVVGMARREDKLKHLSQELKAAGEPGKFHVIKTDLQKVEEISAAFSWIEAELGGADVLVNNAGFAAPVAYLPECKISDWRVMLEVNVLAAAICTREYLMSMEKRRNQTGHIIMLNSVSGHTTEMAQMAIYTSTKHALKAFTKCLRRELSEKGSTIKVTSVSPGPVETDMLGPGGVDLGELFSSMTVLSSDDITAVIVGALSASPASQICEAVISPVPTKFVVY